MANVEVGVAGEPGGGDLLFAGVDGLDAHGEGPFCRNGLRAWASVI